MLSVAIAVAVVSVPLSVFLWMRWRADRMRTAASNASVRALVDETLDQARADREKSSVPKES